MSKEKSRKTKTLSSAAIDHGDFDTKDKTLGSMKHLIEFGFA